MFVKIPEWPAYSINKEGRVYSEKSHKVLSNQVNTRGYSFVRLHSAGTQYSFLISRLLAFVFLDLPSLSSSLEVDHIDGNTLNNNLNNLQVLTHKEHMNKTITQVYGTGYNRNLKCAKCDNILWESNTSGLCKSCYNFARTDDGLTLDLIISEVIKTNWVKAAKIYNISDGGLRRRYKKLSGLNPSNIRKDFPLGRA